MPKSYKIALVALGAGLLASCGSSGVLGRERPDEFAALVRPVLAEATV